MTTTGRNDICPCGSGKKFKKCHGAITRVDPARLYQRLREYDSESTDRILEYAKKRLGNAALQSAWQDFFGDDVPFDLSGPDEDMFSRWFIFSYMPDGITRLAEMFLHDNVFQADDGLRSFIESVVRSPYSFYQVVLVEPGSGIMLRDLLRNREIHVMERMGSTIIQRGHIVIARVVEGKELSIFMGMGRSVIGPRFLDAIINLRTILEQERTAADTAVTDEFLLDYEDELWAEFFAIEDEQNHPVRNLQNTDGEVFSPHTLTYGIPSIEVAVNALKELQQHVSHESDDEISAESKTDPDGSPTEVVLHWLQGAKKGQATPNTVLAKMTIRATELIVEVNSEKRAKRIQKEIKKRLGEHAILLRTEIQTQEQIMKNIEEKKETAPMDEEERLLKESPELKAALAGLLEKHWATWPDVPLPALRGMTPRKAAKDPVGSELLESLLMDFELKNRNNLAKHLCVDVAKLRRVLGMEER